MELEEHCLSHLELVARIKASCPSFPGALGHKMIDSENENALVCWINSLDKVTL